MSDNEEIKDEVITQADLVKEDPAQTVPPTQIILEQTKTKPMQKKPGE